MKRIDPLELARALIACPSVTPHEAGALLLLENLLNSSGFTCHRLTFHEAGTASVDNLYARYGSQGPNLCFAGHTDVVPEGRLDQWDLPPYDPAVKNGYLYGRGAVDMKGAIACFVAAAFQFLRFTQGNFSGSISFLLTNDEEGPAINGTRKVLTWLKERGEALTSCLIGEPSSHAALGDVVSIGHRGSLNTRITIHGCQGHVAFPHYADNPIPRMLNFLTALSTRQLDQGNEAFTPSNLEITTVDVGNPAENMIPAEIHAGFNIRFNDCHTGEDLAQWVRQAAAQCAGTHTLNIRISGEPYRTPVGPLGQSLLEAITHLTGNPARLSTEGGTSDGRFIVEECSDIIEFGLPSTTAHQINERVAIADLESLTQIYYETLKRYFAA